ncbi:DUF4435 domain-containing protein [Microbacterium sp. zg.Y909]|uniref:DUF4435 domain-containing protein n=1 Tax=Microbacterium sp. zg.Y909 TaxID=2969413 RepID=UPI00214C0198|nr:DUF4435 domain-containing protein [Microbacterium sp. zg.Y909]MCR2824293.1 DUF4435 domain-containing protein [Microbacterium sp. zg.Y909]
MLVIVEGPDDLLVLASHVPGGTLFPADGKPNALRAVERLVEWGLEGVRAVVDADFDESCPLEEEGIVITYDGRDLEAMLASLGVLRTVLEHQGSSAKLEALGGVDAACELVQRAAHSVAEIRAANARNSWGLRFDALDVTAKADKRTLELDIRRFAAALVQGSDTEASTTDVVAVVVGSPLDGRGPRGKDIAAFAGFGLRARFGSLPAAATSADVICAQLRSSAGLALERSQWMAMLRQSIEQAAAEVDRTAA